MIVQSETDNCLSFERRKIFYSNSRFFQFLRIKQNSESWILTRRIFKSRDRLDLATGIDNERILHPIVEVFNIILLSVYNCDIENTDKGFT